MCSLGIRWNQFSSVTHSCPTLWDLMDCSMLGFPVHHQLPELSQTHVHRVGDAIHLCGPFSSCLQSLPASGSFIALRIRWPKYGSFSFSISPSNEYSGLISFRIDWLDLLAVQGHFLHLLAVQDHFLHLPTVQDHFLHLMNFLFFIVCHFKLSTSTYCKQS